MNDIDILTTKINEVMKKLKILNMKNHMLMLELEYFKKECEYNKKQINGYTILKKNTEEAVIKIERIIKKIDTIRV
ncbi:MAG: hypothetical protein LBJ68_01360 [Endomicrobium sp.]|nr:hypothetical protein [Endomicrobium sp.]